MKIFKRFILIFTCAVFAVTSFSGCNLFGGGNGCKHRTYGSGSDENSHYKICSDCGEKFDYESHNFILSYAENTPGQHFMRCQLCGYRTDFQPHQMSEWNHSSTISTRRCTTKNCGYEEKCNHSNTTKYVISGSGHHTVCTNCNKTLTAEENHVFNVYFNLTETSHSIKCACGKVHEESALHDLTYARGGGVHWQECECGYETEKVSCSYSEYRVDPTDKTRHYCTCTLCGDTDYGAHNYELKNGERLCKECSHEKAHLARLLGTWKYTDGGKDYYLTLNEDWTYSITCTGEPTDSGIFDANYTQAANGSVSGHLSLENDGVFKPLDFKFAIGETNQFKSGDVTYKKQ